MFTYTIIIVLGITVIYCELPYNAESIVYKDIFSIIIIRAQWYTISNNSSVVYYSIYYTVY